MHADASSPYDRPNFGQSAMSPACEFIWGVKSANTLLERRQVTPPSPLSVAFRRFPRTCISRFTLTGDKSLFPYSHFTRQFSVVHERLFNGSLHVDPFRSLFSHAKSLDDFLIRRAVGHVALHTYYVSNRLPAAYEIVIEISRTFLERGNCLSDEVY